MTVSFFLKRAKNDKKKGIRDAITYGLSIVSRSWSGSWFSGPSGSGYLAIALGLQPIHLI